MNLTFLIYCINKRFAWREMLQLVICAYAWEPQRHSRDAMHSVYLFTAGAVIIDCWWSNVYAKLYMYRVMIAMIFTARQLC